MKIISSEQEAISVKQFATLLGISLAHVYRLIQDGQLPFIKLGTRYLISKKYALSLLDKGDER